MKKFLWSICLIAAGALGVVMISNCIYSAFYEKPRLTAYDNPEFEQMPEVLTYVNVGSSHGGQSFRYAPLGEEIYSQAFNFGMGGQSYIYDYRFLQCYEDRINEEGGVLIVPISIFSLYVDEQLASDYASKILRYYPILDYQYIEGGNRTDYILYKYIYPALPIIKAADKQIDTIFYLQNENAEFEDSRTQYDENGVPMIVQKNYDALLEIIELGCAHQMRVILITTPVQQEFYESYGEKYVEKFHSDVEILTAEISAEYWNFEDLYDHEENYFTDSNHLNEEGAAAFTQFVFEKILHSS